MSYTVSRDEIRPCPDDLRETCRFGHTRHCLRCGQGCEHDHATTAVCKQANRAAAVDGISFHDSLAGRP